MKQEIENRANRMGLAFDPDDIIHWSDEVHDIYWLSKIAGKRPDKHGNLVDYTLVYWDNGIKVLIPELVIVEIKSDSTQPI